MRLQVREATADDVPAMERSRVTDPHAGPADPRMAAYLDGKHHPQQALAPRTAFVAISDSEIIGYIAGHATTRYGCDGEVQYLYVAPSHRRTGVARDLLRSLARWFNAAEIHRVCVNADIDSPGAVAFYRATGAIPLNEYWFAWPDIDVVLG